MRGLKFFLYLSASLVIFCGSLFLMMNFIVMPLAVRSGKTGTVPDVVGKDADKAKRALKTAGFGAAVDSSIHSFDHEAGTVVDQTPRGGLTVKLGRTVHLTLSAGIKEVELPDLFDEDGAVASTRLRALGLLVSQELVDEPSVEEGYVVSSSPPPGSVVPVRTEVTLYISKGIPPDSIAQDSLEAEEGWMETPQ